MSGFSDAKVDMAKEIVFALPNEALKLIQDIRRGDSKYESALKIKYIADFMSKSYFSGAYIERSLNKIKECLLQKKYKEAFQEIENAILIDLNFENQTPLLLGNSLVEVLGSKLAEHGVEPDIMHKILVNNFK